MNRISRMCCVSVAVATGLLSEGAAFGDDAKAERIGDPFPLATCPVSGQPLGSMGDPVVFLHEGREVRLCCKSCVQDFEAEPASYLEKVDEAITVQQMAWYPTSECVVSGEPLEGDMGSPVNLVYGNRLVRFCCKMCRGDFKDDPQTYLAKLDAIIIERQSDDYPLTECVVSGAKLGSMGDPIKLVYANRLVQFCCKGCISKFEASPVTFFAKIDAARAVSDEGVDHAEAHGAEAGHGD